ncbi:MAG: hypothetical protein ACO1SV_23410 [Fimbriimonas sp.]
MPAETEPTYLCAISSQALGHHRKHRPPYPNFPRRIMDMGNAELYVNALAHYWSVGKQKPMTQKKFRLRLQSPPNVTLIEFGTNAEFEALFTRRDSCGFDLFERRAIWSDMELRGHPFYKNHVHGNLSGIALTLQAMVGADKPNLFDLFRLHAQARGYRVTRPRMRKRNSRSRSEPHSNSNGSPPTL